MGKGFRTQPIGSAAAPPYTNGPYSFSEDLRVDGYLSNQPGRVRFEEYFSQLPGVNADLASATESVNTPVSRNFEVLGTNMTSALATFSATEGGMIMTTAGADNDQGIVTPHLDTKQSAWAGYKWGTENQVVYEAAVRMPASIADRAVWVGLKLTNTPVIATDDNAVFFVYNTDNSDTVWRCVSSNAGTDTNTASTSTIAVSTSYRLKIVIDSDRKASFYVDDVFQTKTGALANDIDLIPYIGVQQLDNATGDRQVTVHWQKISRILFE